MLADRVAFSLTLLRDRIGLPLARAAQEFVRRKSWFTFGYARMEDHARERFGRSARWVRDLAALSEAAEHMPGLAEAMTGADGGEPVGRVVALMIGRAATPETCPHWIARARSVTVRELREEMEVARRASEVPPAHNRDGTSGAKNDTGIGGSSQSHGVGEEPAAEGLTSLDDGEERCMVRLLLPASIMAAFEEARDLHSAVCGAEGSVAAFVEALVAETFAGPAKPLRGDDFPRGRPSQAAQEKMFERASDRWEFLEKISGARNVLAEAEATIRKVDQLCGDAAGEAGDPDSLIRSLTHLEDELESRLGELLRMMGESRAWRGLFFAGLGHYAEERLGLSKTTAEARMRLARVLRALPTVREAYEEGRIGSQAAAIIGRVLGRGPVNAHAEAIWVEHAAGTTIKRLRDELKLRAVERAAVPVDRRSKAPPPVPAEDATWHASLARRPGDAIERVARHAVRAVDGCLPDEVLRLRLPMDLAGSLYAALDATRETLLQRCRQTAIFPGPASDAPGSHLHAGGSVSSCSESRPQEGGTGARMFSNRGSESTTLESDVDARVFTIPGSDVLALNAELGARTFSIRGSESMTPGSAVAARMLSITGSDGVAPNAEASISEAVARVIYARLSNVPDWVALLAMIEDFVTTWDDPEQAPDRKADKIYCRDGWRCAAPGCTSRQNLEEHHIVYRSRGGTDDPANRVCLCRFHHQQGEHGGLATCRGKAPLGAVWSLGDRGVGGRFRNERVMAR